MKAKYRHTNIVAEAWRKVAGFCEQVRGIHLRLPGFGSEL